MRATGSAGFSIVIGLAIVAVTACNKGSNQADYYPPNGNPADGNLASVNGSAASYNAPVTSSYEQPVETTQPPPPLPEYSQPPCPGENYVWTPGYWDYSNSGYYWVPGAWVVAPWVGALWTPPWWGYDNGVYIWHAGYWAPHIGFYGGINYGFGYTGHGYYGAYWNGGRLAYNRAVTNIDPARVHDVYDYTPPRSYSRVSFNGRGGVDARPTPQELAVSRDPRTPAVAAQIQHARQASTNRGQFADAHGARPAALVAPHPLSTGYSKPASRPPAEAMRAAARPATETRAPFAPNQRNEQQAARPVPPENRFTPQQLQRPFAESRPEAAPAPAESRRTEPPARPGTQPPVPHQEVINRPARSAPPSPAQFRRGEPVARATPEARPEPAHSEPRIASPRIQAAPRPVPQPEPQARPEPPRLQAQGRPQAQLRPEAQPHSEPQRRVAAPAPHPQPEARTQPQGRAAPPHPQPEQERR